MRPASSVVSAWLRGWTVMTDTLGFGAAGGGSSAEQPLRRLIRAA
ncbi:Unknown protein sequence [Pseudomonas syringae pv. maculicola]|nr:Unknown protein sequence [Pseudomonas syringae pv. maculicola]